jgi:two-component system nitrogen regulation response regulator GlnG/two-component system response regulator HydG
MEFRVLLAEPEAALAGPVRESLEGEGYRVSPVKTAGELLDAVSRHSFEFLVTDASLLDAGEVPLLYFLASHNPNTQVIVTFNASEAGKALRASQQGAHLSLLKPYRPQDLLTVLGKLRGVVEMEESLPSVEEATPFLFHGMVGRSAGMRRVLRVAAKVAPTDSTALITGETGTGKELVAKVIRRLSRRAEGPFITVNCGAIPENLVESELFGHKKGSFTGAIIDKKGLLEVATGGTILLDEVGELPLAAQAKLLRSIEDMEIRRVGDTGTIRVDVRVLASTNRDLSVEVAAGRFREDLWFRLNVVEIHLPPLRERREDIPVLVRFFLNEANRRHGRSVVGVSPEALTFFGNYSFPGNVRELRNIVEHAVVMADQGTIRLEDLPAHAVALSSSHRLLARTAGGGTASVNAPVGFQTIADMEKRLIGETLERVKGNQTEAAKHLGISRSTLWRKMKEYKLGS